MSIEKVSKTTLMSGGGKRKRVIKFKDYSVNMLFAIIPVIGFCIFSLVPYVLSVYMSFTEMHTSEISGAIWVGFRNYKEIFTKYFGEIKYTLLTTVFYTLNVPIGIAISVWIAQLVNRVKIGKAFFRSLFFIPYVCAVTVIVISFRFIFDESSGILNTWLEGFGFEPVRWMTSSPFLFLGCAIIISVWSGLGYKVVLLMAALSKVDRSYYEAAEIDGISETAMFWKITLPAITPTIAFLLTMGLIGSFQEMSMLYVLCRSADGTPMWGGNVIRSYISVTYYLYNMMFATPHLHGFGLASAIGWVLGICIFIITKINMKLQEKWVCYDF